MGGEGAVSLLVGMTGMVLGGLLALFLAVSINNIWRRETLWPWPPWLFVFVGLFVVVGGLLPALLLHWR